MEAVEVKKGGSPFAAQMPVFRHCRLPQLCPGAGFPAIFLKNEKKYYL